jgi:uncharacterized coiled-coil protein SlyX
MTEMQDFVEAAKRAANQAADRLALEADRLRRVSARQREIDLARRERGTLLEQLATVVLDLESRGQITQEPLRALCSRLRALDQEIAAGNAEIQSLKAEGFKLGFSINPSSPASSPRSASVPVLGAPSAARDITCPTCRQTVRGGASFCPTCGTRLR